MRKAPKQAAIKAKNASTTKSNTGPKDVRAYLAAVPEPARSTLKRVRAVILSAVPKEATECISYGMPAFRYNGFLVGYAAFAKHCSFFPGSGSLLQELPDELEGFAISKGTVRFPVDKPFPAPLLKKLVRIRVAKNKAKSAR